MVRLTFTYPSMLPSPATRKAAQLGSGQLSSVCTWSLEPTPPPRGISQIRCSIFLPLTAPGDSHCHREWRPQTVNHNPRARPSLIREWQSGALLRSLRTYILSILVTLTVLPFWSRFDQIPKSIEVTQGMANFNVSIPSLKTISFSLNQRAMWQKYLVVSNCMVLKTLTKTMLTEVDFEAPSSPSQW